MLQNLPTKTTTNMDNNKVEVTSRHFWRAFVRSKGLWQGDIWMRWVGILMVYFSAPLLTGSSSRIMQGTILGISAAIGLFYALIFFMRHELADSDTPLVNELNSLPGEGAYAEHLAGTLVFFAMLMHFLLTH